MKPFSQPPWTFDGMSCWVSNYWENPVSVLHEKNLVAERVKWNQVAPSEERREKKISIRTEKFKSDRIDENR